MSDKSEESIKKNPSLPWWSWPSMIVSLVDRTMVLQTAEDGWLLKRIPGGQFLPLVALVSAALFGFLKPGFVWVYTESLPFMILALVFGLLVPSVSILFILSYAIADLISFIPTFSLGGLAGHMMAYWLLWLLIIDIPRIVTDFTHSLKKKQEPLPLWAVFIGAVLAAATIYMWTLGEPLLIRPFFTWAGIDPSVEAVYTVQELGYILVIAGTIIAFVSGLLKARRPVVTIAGSENKNQFIGFLRYMLPVVLVSGVIMNGIDIALLVVGALVARLVIRRFVGTPSYEQGVGKIPKAFRLVLAFVVTLVFSFVVMQILYSVEAVSEFFPHVLVIAAGFSIFEFFIGESSEKLMRTGAAAVAIVFMALALPVGVAYADNCGDRTDCHGTAGGAAAAAAGAGAAAGLGRKGKGGGEKREKDAIDRAKEATDKLSKIPGGPPLPKKVFKEGLDENYDRWRDATDALKGKTD